MGWIERLAPGPAVPYLKLVRLDRPIGSWLLLFPCWWGLGLASSTFPDLRLMALFALGAVIMRGAGCTVNDIADRDFDRQVARTRTRPIASGAVSVPRAFAFLGLLLLAGFGVLVTFNPFTVGLGIAALPLIAAYPFMKRITYWPQAFLGLTFNWGALMGWAAITGGLAAPALALYAGALFWTLGYDTIYAHQDKQDDLVVGVKSTALRLGEATRAWLFVFYGLAVGLFGLAGWLAGMPWPFYALLAGAALQLGWQAGTVRTGEPADCLAKFKSNKWFGWMLLAAIVAGRMAG
ncbi:MAG: 4-hydroxybenzoate octaprenyltransferase [Alphaproteobacteria bacterium]